MNWWELLDICVVENHIHRLALKVIKRLGVVSSIQPSSIGAILILTRS
jgi:hypothetical protein